MLDRLKTLARDLWWTGDPQAHAFWESLDPALWAALQHNPVTLLSELGWSELPAAHAPAAAALLARHAAALAAPDAADCPPTAYFSMEFGLHESLPIYSGGLGMLAGDHLRSASDLGEPLVAVGVFWHQGYFRQVVHDGRQCAAYGTNEVSRLPVERVVDADGAPVTVRVPAGTESIEVGAWRVQVGKVRLYLLDTDLPANKPAWRQLVHRLYGGTNLDRLLQEVVLGIGGVRLLEAAGEAPLVYHMNEGHAAFLTLELWARGLALGLDPETAWARVRARCVFTTHTPVPAGHDRFSWDELESVLGPWKHVLGLPAGAFIEKGRVRTLDLDETLCMTVLGMRGSRLSNGVSALHGDVTKVMWAGLKEPITSITNGVHPGAWLAAETESLWDEHLPGWRDHLEDVAFWAEIGKRVPRAASHAARQARRARMVRGISARLGRPVLDPALPTLGFARRFATYKRGDLLFRDPERLRAILDRDVQIVFAGKAHPADIPGQAVLATVLRFARDPAFRDRLVFVPDYDMHIGRLLTSGCDVWLNTPRRPREASGTSGMKAAINGNPNCSVLDGWWPEAFDGTNGWAVGDDRDDADEAAQDARDGEALYALLEGVIPATLHDETAMETMALRSMATCVPVFNTHRMVRSYARTLYRPAPRGPEPAR